MDEGLAGSIADEFAPLQTSEAVGAVADMDAYVPAAALPEVQPEPIAPAAEPQVAERAPQETATSPSPEAATELEKHAPRRSTVREKVSFLSNPSSEAPAPVVDAAPIPSAPAPAEPAPEAPQEAPPPRRAGWWSRRFGSSE